MPRNTNGMKWRAEARSGCEEIPFGFFVALIPPLHYLGCMKNRRKSGWRHAYRRRKQLAGRLIGAERE
jgi:hypothetical protein